MNRKEALRQIEQRLQEGKTKKEVYLELSSKVKSKSDPNQYRVKVKSKSDLNQYIAAVPSIEDKLKYRKLNLILFSMLVYLGAIRLVTGLANFTSLSVFMLFITLCITVICIYLATNVWKFRGGVYRAIVLLGIISILKIISNLYQLYTSYTPTELLIEILSGALPVTVCIILAFYLGKKVFPYYGLWGQIKEEELYL